MIDGKGEKRGNTENEESEGKARHPYFSASYLVPYTAGFPGNFFTS